VYTHNGHRYVGDPFTEHGESKLLKQIRKNKVASTVAGLALTVASVAGVLAGTEGSALATPAAAAGACDASANLHVWYAYYGSGTQSSPTYTTTSKCVDINFGVREFDEKEPVGKVRVCFVGAGYCQSSWKSYNGSTQNDIVVASNVKDGTTYKIEWQWTSGDMFGAAIYA